MSKLLLGRHGSTQETRKRFHGITDEPLDAKGINEANELASFIKSVNPGPIEECISSDLPRSEQTARIITGKIKIPLKINKACEPLDSGQFVGLPVDKYLEQFKYYIKNPNIKFPGGETFARFANRWLSFISKYFYGPSDKTYLFIVHGRNILMVHAWMVLGAPKNLKYDTNMILDNKRSTEHGGLAVVNPPKDFQILTPKLTMKGAS